MRETFLDFNTSILEAVGKVITEGKGNAARQQAQFNDKAREHYAVPEPSVYMKNMDGLKSKGFRPSGSDKEHDYHTHPDTGHSVRVKWGAVNGRRTALSMSAKKKDEADYGVEHMFHEDADDDDTVTAKPADDVTAAPLKSADTVTPAPTKDD